MSRKQTPLHSGREITVIIVDECAELEAAFRKVGQAFTTAQVKVEELRALTVDGRIRKPAADKPYYRTQGRGKRWTR